jgi:hypothetical protein
VPARRFCMGMDGWTELCVACIGRLRAWAPRASLLFPKRQPKTLVQPTNLHGTDATQNSSFLSSHTPQQFGVQSFTTLTCGARLNLGPRSQCRSQVNSGCTVLRPQYYYHGSTHISVMMMMMSDATSQPTHRTERNGTKHLIRR